MRKYILNLALKFQGISYIWGGSSPQIGFDCSGFVIWILQVFDFLPSGDWTADGLKHYFESTDDPQIGDLVFYGTQDRITHVMMFAGLFNGGFQVIGASGGDSTCVVPEISKQKNAMVKMKPLKYRNDFVCYGNIEVKI